MTNDAKHWFRNSAFKKIVIPYSAIERVRRRMKHFSIAVDQSNFVRLFRLVTFKILPLLTVMNPEASRPNSFKHMKHRCQAETLLPNVRQYRAVAGFIFRPMPRRSVHIVAAKKCMNGYFMMRDNNNEIFCLLSSANETGSCMTDRP